MADQSRLVRRAIIVDDDRVRARTHLAAARPERVALPTTQQGKFHLFIFLLGLCVTDCGEAPSPLIRIV